MKLRRIWLGLAGLALVSAATGASAWGYEGHKVVAAIARPYLNPAVAAKVNALLAADPDTLTAPDMLSRATWADAWRGAGHRETAEWHFVDIELDHPDIDAACFDHPASARPASAGPAQACLLDRLSAFTAELADPATPQPERILALKYVLHFVGDLHQPLHASDNQDRGGNCVRLALGGSRTVTLHSYWDTTVVEALGRDPQAVGDDLRRRISGPQKAAWEKGDARAWALESYGVAKATAYRVGSAPGCPPDPAPVALPDGYAASAQAAAALQLERAGVRMALVLNRALANVTVPAAQSIPTPSLPAGQSGPPPRSEISLQCSAEADAKGLHGAARQDFRRRCKAGGAKGQP